MLEVDADQLGGEEGNVLEGATPEKGFLEEGKTAHTAGDRGELNADAGEGLSAFLLEPLVPLVDDCLQIVRGDNPGGLVEEAIPCPVGVLGGERQEELGRLRRLVGRGGGNPEESTGLVVGIADHPAGIIDAWIDLLVAGEKGAEAAEGEERIGREEIFLDRGEKILEASGQRVDLGAEEESRATAHAGNATAEGAGECLGIPAEEKGLDGLLHLRALVGELDQQIGQLRSRAPGELFPQLLVGGGTHGERGVTRISGRSNPVQLGW